MRIGVYQSYWGGIGGGQRYLGAAAQLLAADHDVEIVHHCPDFRREAVEEALELDLARVRFRPVPQADRPAAAGLNPFRRYAAERDWCADLSRPYDLFIHCTNAVPFFCHARRGLLVTYFPETSAVQFQGRGTPGWQRRPALLRLAAHAYQAWEWQRRYAGYDRCVTCSEYSRGWLKERWGVDAAVVYPPLRNGFRARAKANRVLSIGRFDGSQHKKHGALIRAFRDLYDGGLRDWELILVGAVSDTPEDRAYLGQLRAEAAGYPVSLRTNVPARELRELLEAAAVLWHSMGYGVDEAREPGRLEHFGMVGTEALAAGCIPMLFDGGGLREIVRHGKDGFLWRTTEELTGHTRAVAREPALRGRLAAAGPERAGAFSQERFVRRFTEVVAPLLASR